MMKILHIGAGYKNVKIDFIGIGTKAIRTKRGVFGFVARFLCRTRHLHGNQ